MDNEAIDVKWEVVIEEEKKNSSDQTETQVLAQGGVSSMFDIEGMPESSGALGDIGVFRVLIYYMYYSCVNDTKKCI